jgi:hypothetical protein
MLHQSALPNLASSLNQEHVFVLIRRFDEPVQLRLNVSGDIDHAENISILRIIFKRIFILCDFEAEGEFLYNRKENLLGYALCRTASTRDNQFTSADNNP